MKDLTRTSSLSWAESVRIALAAEGIESVVLDRSSLGAHGGVYMQMRVAVIDDSQLERAQAVLARLRPPASGDTAPPPSWRWQKRGLLVLGLGIVLLGVSGSLLDREEPLPVAAVYGAFGLTALTFVLGFVLIALGPRADKGS